ncbi:MmpS family transport accessory protein [Mycobacteroides sp. CBMA 271]|uniref:MmpS family transport accessory protein n=1 Tax=Mycobacteroides sp. CBMA 271 TaxID=2606608 RepID=UPI0028BD48BF|nr:MmpS family transport accessory protein [Mycobacteroides sp. CBMA 271]
MRTSNNRLSGPSLSRRFWDVFVERQGWVFALIAVLWMATGTYVLGSPKLALPNRSETPKPAVNAGFSMPKPKTVTYQVTSTGGAPVTVSYLDDAGQSRLYSGDAPWQTTVTTNDFAFAAGVTAISANNKVTCRIDVEGEVADEKSESGSHPTVSCNLLAFRKIVR